MQQEFTNDPAVQALRAFATAVQDAAPSIATTMQPLMDNLRAGMHALYDAYRDEYRRRGEPYGPGDDAMFAYMSDVAALQRIVDTIETERIWQEGLRDLREHVAQQRR